MKLLHGIIIAVVCMTPVHSFAQTYDRFYFEKRKEIIWETKIEEPMLAFTFDDGPDPIYTKEILRILEKYHAHATFFVVGKNMKAYPDVVKNVVDKGHELGNHTYNHVKFVNTEETVVREELRETQQLIEQFQKGRTKLLRPPTGYYDKRVVDIFTSEKYTTVLWGWNKDTEDWKEKNSDSIVSRILPHVQRGDIILMHDAGGDRTVTIEALDKLLKVLSEKGFQFVTLSELLMRDERYAPFVNQKIIP